MPRTAGALLRREEGSFLCINIREVLCIDRLWLNVGRARAVHRRCVFIEKSARRCATHGFIDLNLVLYQIVRFVSPSCVNEVSVSNSVLFISIRRPEILFKGVSSVLTAAFITLLLYIYGLV